MFELGIKRSIEWLTKTRYGKPYPLSSNYQIANSQLQSSLSISFSITDKLPDIQDVIIFLSTCITTAIRQGTKDPRDLKYLFETLNPYVVLIR